jgi:hypothetical protein
MTFMFEPARSLLVVAAVLLIVGILSLVLGSRAPGRKGIRFVIAIALAVVMLLRYQSYELTVDDAGIAADTYGQPVILWAEVEEARYVPMLSASRYMPRPTLKSRLRIIGYNRARYGRFDSASGERALFALQRFDADAIVVATSESTYVFAPSDVRGLADAIAEHVPVSGLDAAQL